MGKQSETILEENLLKQLEIQKYENGGYNGRK